MRSQVHYDTELVVETHRFILLFVVNNETTVLLGGWQYWFPSWFPFGLRVHHCRDDNTGSANDKGKGGMEIKENGRQNTRNDNTEGSGKDLEDIVGILDDYSDNESSNSLYRHYGPDNGRITPQESLFGHGGRIFDIDCQKGNDYRGQSHLNIS